MESIVWNETALASTDPARSHNNKKLAENFHVEVVAH
jgi:hypothetical protein